MSILQNFGTVKVNNLISTIMKFRNDINGLRFLAVIMVVLYHYGFAGFAGGFIGVDIFFVISGFLMTSIVCNGIEKDKFSLWRFYCARAKRIIPALLAVIVTVTILGWFFLFPSEYKQLGKHVISSLFFVSDITYWKESGYFDSGAAEKWLLHTWSLSVEWQFYIFYPVIIIGFLKLMPKVSTLKLLSFLFLASLGIGIYAGFYKPDAGFFLLPSRAWEMLAGGIVSQIRPAMAIPNRVKFSIQLICIGALAICCIMATPLGWPGYKALLPVIFSSVLIYLNSSSVILDNRLSQHIGKISYSLYLWHWPVFVALTMFSRADIILWKLSGLLVAYALSLVSYNLIEKNTKLISGKINHFFYISFALLSLFSLSMLNFNGFDSAYRQISQTSKSRLYEKYRVMHDNWHGYYKDGCDFYNVKDNNHKSSIESYCVKQEHVDGVFLWGDSHAQALSDGVRAITPSDWDFYQVATSSCEPTIGKPLKKAFLDNNCVISNSYALLKIKELKPKVVIIAQRSLHHLNNWNNIATKLKGMGVKHVVVMGPMVQWEEDLSKLISRKDITITNGYASKYYVDSDVFREDDLIKRIKDKNFNFVSLVSNMCNPSQCLSLVPNSEVLMVMDYGHLTHEASIYVGKSVIFPQIKAYFDKTNRG